MPPLTSLLDKIFSSRNVSSTLGWAVISAFFVVSASAQTPSSVTGVWFDSVGEGGIEVAPCGNRMCGNIVWLKQPLNAEGKPLYDRHNPNTSLQSRPICGLQVLRDLQPLTDGSWGRGIVYDPKKGAENEASIKPMGGGKLMLTGYGLFGLSKSFEWTRAPDNLQRCGGTAALPAAAAGGAAAAIKNTAAPAAASANTPKPAAPAAAKPAAAASMSAPAIAPQKQAEPARQEKPVSKSTGAPDTPAAAVKPASAASDKKPAAAKTASSAAKQQVTANPVATQKSAVSKTPATAAIVKPLPQAAKAPPQATKAAATSVKTAAPVVKVISKAPPAATQATPAAAAKLQQPSSTAAAPKPAVKKTSPPVTATAKATETPASPAAVTKTKPKTTLEANVDPAAPAGAEQ